MHRLYAAYGTYGRTAGETFELTDDAKKVRRYFEDYFLERGTGPGPGELMEDLGLGQNRTWDALHQLERGVQVMFVAGTENFLKMPPFSFVPTRHRVDASDGRRWYAGCALEASAFSGLLPGQEVVVTSVCPDCWEPIIIRTRDRAFVDANPPEAVIHIGVHPRDFAEDWIVTCDSINFFKSQEHVDIWEQTFPEKRGVVMPISLGPKWVEGIAAIRYWDYDRGPDIVSTGTDMVERFRSVGVDVSRWT